MRQVKTSLLSLQKNLHNQVLKVDPLVETKIDEWEREEGGGGKTITFANGQIIEKGGVNFSDVSGTNLPKTATQNRPELEGASFRAMGVSVVFHPDNPHIPTSHANVRYFEAKKEKNLLTQIRKKNFSYIEEVDTLNLILFMIAEPTLDCNPGGERNLY